MDTNMANASKRSRPSSDIDDRHDIDEFGIGELLANIGQVETFVRQGEGEINVKENEIKADINREEEEGRTKRSRSISRGRRTDEGETRGRRCDDGDSRRRREDSDSRRRREDNDYRGRRDDADYRGRRGTKSSRMSHSRRKLSLPYRLLFPSGSIGIVVGRNGSTVKDIQNASGASVRFQKERDDGPVNSTEKIVTILGTKSQKNEALKMILEKILPVIKVQNLEGKETIIAIVPLSAVSLIIGPKGQRIQELSKQSNCEIQIHKGDLEAGINERTFTVRSTEVSYLVEGVSNVYEFLESLVESGKVPETDFNMNPTHVNPNAYPSLLGAQPVTMYKNSVGSESSAVFTPTPPAGKNLLQHPLGKQSSRVAMRFAVTADAAAWIVGKSGSHIKDIKLQTGAEFTISEAKPENSLLSDKDRVLTVKGSIITKYNVLTTLIPMMEQKLFNAEKPLRILIPARATSYIIGLKGVVIKQIIRVSNAAIQVDNHDTIEGERMMYIRGQPEAKSAAATAVLQKLEEYENPDIGREGLLIPVGEVSSISGSYNSSLLNQSIMGQNIVGITGGGSGLGVSPSGMHPPSGGNILGPPPSGILPPPSGLPPPQTSMPPPSGILPPPSGLPPPSHTLPPPAGLPPPSHILPPPAGNPPTTNMLSSSSYQTTDSLRQNNSLYSVYNNNNTNITPEQSPYTSLLNNSSTNTWQNDDSSIESRFSNHMQLNGIAKKSTDSPKEYIIDILLPKNQVDLLVQLEKMGAPSFSDIAKKSHSQVRLGIELNNGMSRSVILTGSPMANAVGVLLLQERLIDLCKPI